MGERSSSEPFRHLPQIQETYLRLGQAVAAWQAVETSIFVAFHVALGASFKNSSLIFFHMRSIDVKFALLRKMVEEQTSQKIFNDHWRSLEKRAENQIRVRNALVHFELIESDLEFKPLGDITKSPLVLTSHHLDHYAMRSGNQPLLPLETIRVLPGQFFRLADDICRFAASNMPAWESQIALLPEDLSNKLKLLVGSTDGRPQE